MESSTRLNPFIAADSSRDRSRLCNQFSLNKVTDRTNKIIERAEMKPSSSDEQPSMPLKDSKRPQEGLQPSINLTEFLKQTERLRDELSRLRNELRILGEDALLAEERYKDAGRSTTARDTSINRSKARELVGFLTIMGLFLMLVPWVCGIVFLNMRRAHTYFTYYPI